ncbi:MAG: XRE family transcriptional regulator [Bdellovibrionales bacterium CG10_big_fil_rev_8_21_14_0_10_45_34]|nr:MAG: XRE family transcriptional regulator [Bdellovibrionales bacterium CG10_big_fil_rev_8_21_14_0_10_45_34]
MSARKPRLSRRIQTELQSLGDGIRQRRKALGISASVAAESAGISRVTLYRIEKGEDSVSMGAYLSIIASLGFRFHLELDGDTEQKSAKDLKEKVSLSDYPQLKKLAWQTKASRKMNLEEVLNVYERNWRHIDFKAMDPSEKAFIKKLLRAFGRKRLLV